ncbi:hypothetical protein CBS147321_1038 [Aspergillus niger]|nr:hypothetical protein CBS133816_8552 [Aspergillus niger]KAI2943094.1 hypothetical protein CBS147322_8625 [Aspergillus niger]KAI2951626.1 hypothetical protein CBS147321_1038 [Aspergillus niger]KAI2962527.1 hypothetical protein CBS147324_9407 [Aspergillus niger]KAI3025074.1 hypothetical protein CBS147347_5861 [Aspergillus niger]
MHCRRRPNVNNHGVTSESSCTSPIDTDNDRPFEPDSSGTDLTEPECSSPAARKINRKKSSPSTGTQPSEADSPGVERIHRARYQVPDDDTDEDLAQVPEDYGRSNDTKKLKHRLKERWAWFCQVKAREPSADLKWGNAEDALREASPNDMHRFLNWCLKLEYSPDGRRQKGYKKASALDADWKYFRIYYTRVTKHEMSKEMGEAVRTGMRYLIDKRGLDKQPRANVPVYIEDMVPFNETILSTREKRFYLGFQRIILCLYNTIGLFTINRKHAILDLQFKHLQLSLQQDPHGGPPVLTIEFQPEFVKSVLGMSKLNTFTLPEVVYGVSLVFSPHVLLLIILFYVQAFEAPHLTSMEDLRRLLIEGGRQEMPLPLKKGMDNYYVFPRVQVIDGQPCILWETPMSGSALDAQLRTFSEIHGFLNHFFSHQFRYGGGDLLDKSGFVSEAQRNVIMNHATSSTFIKHYRPRRHTGLQEIMCGLNPDEEFSRAVTRMSRWIDRRRPRYLSDSDRASVENDPELQSAMRWQYELESQCGDRPHDPALRAMLEDQKRQVHNLRRRLQDKRRKEIRRDFSRKQAVIDIERQLTGGAVSDDPAREVLRKEFAMPSEQILLVETFFTWPITDSLEDEWTRRNKAVAAGIKYCGFQEGGPLRGRPKRSARSSNLWLGFTTYLPRS